MKKLKSTESAQLWKEPIGTVSLAEQRNKSIYTYAYIRLDKL